MFCLFSVVGRLHSTQSCVFRLRSERLPNSALVQRRKDGQEIRGKFCGTVESGLSDITMDRQKRVEYEAECQINRYKYKTKTLKDTGRSRGRTQPPIFFNIQCTI